MPEAREAWVRAKLLGILALSNHLQTFTCCAGALLAAAFLTCMGTPEKLTEQLMSSCKRGRLLISIQSGAGCTQPSE